MNAKNRTARGTFLAALVIIAATSPLAAQTKKLSAASLDPAGISDYTFVMLHDPLLYPETAFELNPAVLTKLKQKLVLIGTDAVFERSEKTLERLDGSLGLKGGTMTSVSQSFLPNAGFSAFIPKGKRGAEKTLGFSLSAEAAKLMEQDSFTDYNFYSERTNRKLDDLTWNAGGDLYYAKAGKSAVYGASAGYVYDYAPALFREETDASVVPSALAIKETLRDSRIITHGLESAVGMSFPLSSAAECSLSLRYVGAFRDASNKMTPFDSDGNGTLDTVMPESAYALYTGAGGPLKAATAYDAKDITIDAALTIHPYLRLYLMKDVELFLSGDYSLLNISDRSAYEHYTYADSLEADQSFSHGTFDGGLSSFAIMPGVSVRTGKTGLLKIGAGYRRSDLRYRQDGTSREGLNAYSRLNPENYTELALGLEPKNDSLVDSGVIPSRDLEQTLMFKAGWENRVSSTLSLFFRTDVSASRRERTWNAFNLDTRSVWSETGKDESLKWQLNPILGLALKTGKSGMFTLDVGRSASTGSVGSENETAPFGINENRASENGEKDLSAGKPFKLELHAGMVFSF